MKKQTNKGSANQNKGKGRKTADKTTVKRGRLNNSKKPVGAYAIYSEKLVLVSAVILGLYHLLICQLSYFLQITVFQDAELYLCCALGVLFILYCLVKRPAVKLKAEYVVLIAIMIWYLISCFVMKETYKRDWLSYNRKPLIDTAIALFVFFPLGSVAGKSCFHQKQKNLGNQLIEQNQINNPASETRTGDIHDYALNPSHIITIIIHILLLSWTVFIAYVLINVFQLKLIDLPNGGQIGMSKSAALCLNCHYNTTGAWQMLFFLSCLCMIICSKRILIKSVYSVAAVINFIALVLSNSRTSYVATMAGFMGIAFVCAYQTAKSVPTKKRIVISVIISFVSGAVFYMLRGTVYDLFQSVTHFSQLVGGGNKDMTDSMARKVISSTTATLTGRTTIWKGALKGMVSSAQRFFFGVTPVSVNSLISLMTDGKYNMYTHNEILEVGVALGVPAMCAFIVWLVLILRRGYSQLKNGLNHRILPLVLILALLLANMAEATLLFYQYITGLAFFFLCGWLYGTTKELQAE